ncbi:MAG: chemotaxis protein CheC [Methylovulum sp.]|nr:chemotaxis protein CheC [Methylovulum sp.]
MLSEIQLDALAEIFNVGAGRAASSISEIIHDEVKLSVPSIEFKTSAEISPEALSLNHGRFGTVRQDFSGSFDAVAMLLFSEDNALEIVRDMMGSQMSLDDLAEFEQEAMCELGNIILNACLSAMADMLSISLDSSLPDYKIASCDDILHAIAHNAGQDYILVLNIVLTSAKRQTEGQLILLLSSASLTNLIQHIDGLVSGI